MGWRGALRSIAAAQRAAERESVRRHRAYERLSKEQAKLDALHRAAAEVDAFENLIARITSVHADCGEKWNWGQHANASPPNAPEPVIAGERTAQQRLNSYTPGLLDKLFRRADRKRTDLRRAVESARRDDQTATSRAQEEFTERYRDWSEMKDLARRIIDGDPLAFRDATEELSPLSELSDLGSRIELGFRKGGLAEATLQVNSEAVIPSEVKTLLQSGKLSTKRMPQARFYELYQDYVAGSVLRIARELMALLPVDTVLVTATANMLDTASGHLKDCVILSVVIPRRTLETLNFSALDPSDSLRNFKHSMDFKKTKGFAPVRPLTIGQAPARVEEW